MSKRTLENIKRKHFANSSGHNIAINALDFKDRIPFEFDRICSEKMIPVRHPYNFGWAEFLTIIKPKGYQFSEISSEPDGFELKMAEYVSRYEIFWHKTNSWLDRVIEEYRAEANTDGKSLMCENSPL